MEEKTVTVPNISCGHCVNTIQREVAEANGVASVKGDAKTREVVISWDPEATDWVAIEKEMSDIGYPPKG